MASLILGMLIYLFFPPGNIRYYIPDLLWSFSFTLALNAISTDKRLIAFNVLLPLLIGIIYEVGQKKHFWSGTFDVVDIIVYSLGIFLARLLCIPPERLKQ